MLARVVRSRIGRNTLLNLGGLAIPLAVAALLFPVLTHALGTARFGLLGISWAFLEYLTLFDIGLGKATVRFVAESLARGTEDVSQIASVSVTVQVAIGVVAALLLGLLAPLISAEVVRVDPAMIPEATRLFRVVALNLPVVLALTTLRGVLDGAQRFAASNAIKVPASAGAIIIPAVLATYGVQLPEIMSFVLAWRVIVCVVTLLVIARTVPGFRVELPRDWVRLRGMIGFGGWVAISGVLSPVLVYFDRFALGARTGLTAVGYYTAPYEGITRFVMIPNSLINAIFPLITGLGVVAATARIERLFAVSLRVLVLLMIVPSAVAFVWGPEILGFWMGSAYAQQAGLALRILAVGVLVNAVAHIPYTFLEAAGRPDVPAKFHMVETLIHLPLAWYLVGRFGVTGAAAAWTSRVALDALLLLLAARRILPVSLRRAIIGWRLASIS